MNLGAKALPISPLFVLRKINEAQDIFGLEMLVTVSDVKLAMTELYGIAGHDGIWVMDAPSPK